jgi:hypothetical protein
VKRSGVTSDERSDPAQTRKTAILRRVMPVIALGWLLGAILELIGTVGFWDAIG